MSNELAAFWRSSIDSTSLLPSAPVVGHILAGHVSDEIYESGNPKQLVAEAQWPGYDYDEPPF